MKRYEYDYLIFDDLHTKEAIDECNEMGKEGWELVSHSIYCDSAGIEGHNVCLPLLLFQTRYFMITFVYELATKHEIFISILPKCEGYELRYKYRIEEPIYDKFAYCGYRIENAIESKDTYYSYDEALANALCYVKKNARKAGNGMLTLSKERME